jgi:hypothetical protein
MRGWVLVHLGSLGEKPEEEAQGESLRESQGASEHKCISP